MKPNFLYCFCISTFLSYSLAHKVRYDGYKVLRLTPETEEHLNLLDKLKRVKGLSFWRGPTYEIGIETDVMIPPHLVGGDLLKAVEESGIQNQEYTSDLQTLIEEGGGNGTIDKTTRLNWQQYAGLETIYQFLEEQASLHSRDVTLISIGQSFEGRDLKVLKISKGDPKPGIWVDSNIHAREWISGAVVTFMINELLNGVNPQIRSWADYFDFYFLPVVNPDGFEYSHTVDRIWRKTRSTSPNSICRGVDANRNFGFKWQSGGSSYDPCDETYAGPSPFSEPETLAFSKYYSSLAAGLVGFISLHSYGQLILLPYGVRGIQLPQHREHMEIAAKVSRAMSKRQGTVFRSGSIAEVLYPASGGSIDWVKAVHTTNLTLVFELRDTGRYGFLLPPEQIIPTSLEFLDGFQVIIDELRAGVPPSTESKSKAVLKLQSPVTSATFDAQTFGVLPSRLNSAIIPGFIRY